MKTGNPASGWLRTAAARLVEVDFTITLPGKNQAAVWTRGLNSDLSVARAAEPVAPLSFD